MMYHLALSVSLVITCSVGLQYVIGSSELSRPRVSCALVGKLQCRDVFLPEAARRFILRRQILSSQQTWFFTETLACQ
ncbi:hypothetical protein BDW71DRAFT_190037 [Aspergillus fruticulosus]